MKGARAVVALAVGVLAVPLASSARADACPGRSVGRWSRLPAPSGATQVVPLATRCALLAVTRDGSVRRWDGTSYARVLSPATRVVAAEAGVVVAATAGGVAVSDDDGRTFALASLPGEVVAAAVTRDGTRAALVATWAGAVTALWRSADGGASFRPAGTVPVRPVALAYDTWTAGTVWLAAGTGGVWRSVGGEVAWQPVEKTAAYDLDVAVTPSGSRVAIASSDGMWQSVEGAPWSRVPAPSLSALRLDDGGAYAVSGGTPWRVDAAARPATAGLPRCDATALASDRAGTYVLACGGSFYGLVSGSRVGGGAGGVPGVGRTVNPLTPLRTLHLPRAGGSSGSLAFDGHALYFGADPARPIELMSPEDGRHLGTVRPGVPAKFFSYDSGRGRLWVDDGTRMWVRSPRDGRTAAAFPSDYGYRLSYDAVHREHLGITETDSSRTLLRLDEHGTVTGQCSLVPALSGVYTPHHDPSAIVATADGAYVVLEDDMTILRVGRDCALRSVNVTRVVSESTLENDQMVCDPLTFAPRTALWIRDSGFDTVSAYDLPDAYCPFVATLSVSAPSRTRAGGVARVCATLVSAARREPIAAQPVTLDVGGVSVATAPTDARGRTCAVTSLPAPGRARVGARFAGTAQWTPATASASTLVAAVTPPGALPPYDAPTLTDPPAAALAVAPGPPPPPAPAGPAHLPQAQSQPNPQHQAGHGTQAGLAPDEQDEPQLAYAGDDTYAMSRRTDGAAALLLLGAGMLTAAATWAARHQQTYGPARQRAGPGRSRDPRRRGHAVPRD